MSPTRPKPDVTAQDMAETVVPGREGGGDSTQASIGAEVKQTAAAPAPGASKKGVKVSQGSSSEKKVARLGDFEIRKQLGQGGMGKVYLAHQISLDRPCALKVMSRELAEKPGFVERFIREARSMAKIDHPNVVKCYAVDEQEGKHFVAMELIDGKSMQDWLDELGQLSVADALYVTLICADALGHAHSLNMIHRDIKPDNILVTKHGVVKVADLGLAKALDEDMSMTQSGTGLGTPHYMPPEQARNAKHVDARCDIYALGCTLYHFTTGKLPFSGDSVIELIKAKEMGVFTSARRHNSNIPSRLDLIIDKMMAKDPKHRYASCAEVIRDLSALELAGPSLSFIDSDAQPGIRPVGGVPPTRVASVPTAPAARASQKQRPTRQRSREESSNPAASSPEDDRWYVRYQDSKGKIKVSKMTRAQILQGLRTDRLNLRTSISRSSKQDFRPIYQVPAFEGEVKQAAARAQSHNREAKMANAYARIERQYNRQKWWRMLSRFRDGTLGAVGLILWLAIVAAAVVGLGFAVMFAYRYLGTSLNLE